MLNRSSKDSSRLAEFPLEAFRTVNCDKKVEHGHTAQHPSQHIDGLRSDTFAILIPVDAGLNTCVLERAYQGNSTSRN